MPYSNNDFVCINPDTTLPVFLSLYQSRYNSPCILEYALIQIQLALELLSMYLSTHKAYSSL